MNQVPKVVVLGVGNTLMHDDGIGVWVVRALRRNYTFPKSVCLIEGGIAGLKLLPDITQADELLIIDAMKGGGPPGTVHHLGAEQLPRGRGPLMSAHEVGIVDLLAAARLLGQSPHCRIIGVEPAETRTVGLALTPALRDALPDVIAAVIEELRGMGITAINPTRVALDQATDAGREMHDLA